MATTNIGQVSIVPMGAFNLGTAYKRLSVVTYNGSSYIAKQDNQNIAITNTAYWYLLASKGDKGDTYEVTPEDLQAIADQITSDASSAFNTHVTEKTTEFDNHVTSKTGDFDTNASNKTTTFNNNATSKTTDFNTNATNKTTDFNTNATNKTTAFNSNASDKVDYYNANADEVITMNEQLLDQIPRATVTGTVINVADSSNLPIADIRVLGETYQLQTTGKNLLYMPDQSVVSSGLRVSIVSGIYYITGINSGTSTSITLTTNLTLPAGTYTLSTNSDNAHYPYASLKNGSTTIVDMVYEDSGVKTFTLAEETTFDTVYLYFKSASPTRLALQIETGSSATAFEPYTGGQSAPRPDFPETIKVVTGDVTLSVLGKNLLDLSSRTNSSCTSTWSNDILTITSTSGTYNRISVDVTNLLMGNRGKRVNWSYDSYSLTEGRYSVQFMITWATGGTTYVPLIASSDYYYDIPNNVLISSAVLNIYQNNASTSTPGTLTVVKPMLSFQEDGIYEPYTGQSQLLSLGSMELAKIGDYQDYIYKSEGKWYKYEKIHKETLDGTENWSAHSRNGSDALAYMGIYSTSNAIPTKSYNADTNPLVVSNKFKRASYTDFYNRTVVNGIARFKGSESQTANKDIFVAVDRNSLTSYNLTGFKAWLSTNTPVIYYVVETPTITEITDSTLLGQLNNLLLMKTYKNIANLFTVTAGETPSLKVVYRKDLETLFNQVATLEARVELLEN